MEDYIIRIIAALGMLLISWINERVVKLISTKIKNEKAQKYLSEIYLIVSGAVKSTYQETVETLKKEGKFDEAAQKQALETAKSKIRLELTDRMYSYLEKNIGDIEVWLNTAIHSELYDLKK